MRTKTLAEKVRALWGQRQFAISRDLYHIYRLTGLRQVDLERIRPFVRDKFAAKGTALEEVDPGAFNQRRGKLQHDWENNLRSLLPASDGTSFEEAWQLSLAGPQSRS